VNTTPYSPEYGRTSAGVISFAMRSGGNTFHGTAHAFLRNSVLDANGFNANRALRPRQKLQRNQFGGTFGGPVWIPKIYKGENKTFFFVAYEGLREAAASSFVGSVLTVIRKRRILNWSRAVTDGGMELGPEVKEIGWRRGSGGAIEEFLDDGLKIGKRADSAEWRCSGGPVQTAERSQQKGGLDDGHRNAGVEPAAGLPLVLSVGPVRCLRHLDVLADHQRH
jgi:hypothetical protein